MTGEQASLADSAAPLIARMRKVTNLPLALGFGISTPQQAASVARLADAVVVGSAIVRQIETDLSGLEAMVRSLAQGLS